MAEMIKIESGIPIPERASNMAAKYPFNDMKVGDSFLVPRINGEPVTVTRERATKAISYAKRKGGKYCSRTNDEGTRVWRLS